MRIGLTGGIGSGKSTVAALLLRHGAALVDTDAIARRLAAPGGAAIDAIRLAFGDGALDAAGGLDRARMRERVFAEPGARQRLEAILHPLIGAESEREAAAASGRTIVFDVPLLVESGRWRRQVERVWVVDCRTETQLERVLQRPGWSRDAALGAIASQATRATRRAAADAVLYNDGITLAELEGQIRILLERVAGVG